MFFEARNYISHPYRTDGGSYTVSAYVLKMSTGKLQEIEQGDKWLRTQKLKKIPSDGYFTILSSVNRIVQFIH